MRTCNNWIEIDGWNQPCDKPALYFSAFGFDYCERCAAEFQAPAYKIQRILRAEEDGSCDYDQPAKVRRVTIPLALTVSAEHAL